MSSDQSKHSKVFLVTTAMEEFWDTSLPIVFMGEWCRTYDRKVFWESFGDETVECPWNDKERFYQTLTYIEYVYELFLEKLTIYFNRMHHTRRGSRYWRILVGPWLRWYINVMYDRYTYLRTALEEYPHLTTIVLSESSYTTPMDTLEYIKLVSNDPYNLQTFSRILKYMGKIFPEKVMDEKRENKEVYGRITDSIVKHFLKKVVCFSFNRRNCIFLKNSYFSSPALLTLLIRSLGRVAPVQLEIQHLPVVDINKGMRSQIKELGGENRDFFCKMLQTLMPSDIPKCCVENFEIINEYVARNYPSKPAAIATSDCWYFDEGFKQWAAGSSELGTILLGIQHGGNYGSLAHTAQDHEILITDRFYSWGWTEQDFCQKILPKPSPKLSGRSIRCRKDTDGILFVTTSMPRYLFQFPFLPCRFADYLSWQIRFIKSMSVSLVKKVRLRAHQFDFGWCVSERIQDVIGDVSVESWETPFTVSLAKSRLVICDSLTTTFLESLSFKKPTILFWNLDINELRLGAQKYYDELNEVGILHHSPEDAAHIVDQIYDNVEMWWNDRHRQAVLDNFCGHFALESKDYIDEWLDEFKNVFRADITSDKSTKSTLRGKKSCST